ncbi:MAG: (2Fe-2S)-binding protein [Bradymonadales bacterium]|jgi:aerobic-type carbon monoxide dehydrogenase small subunit (CoxS/CutS family)
MQITVNQKLYQIDDSREKEYLLDYIREDLDLTGSKNGCGVGVCGACVVLIDDKPQRACRQTLKRCDGKSVVTIEGFSEAETLHPLQQSFLDCAAVQCGYCIPGMVLSGHALLMQNQNPSREEIRKAINNNLCRCTGYKQIVDAIQEAAPHYAKK